MAFVSFATAVFMAPFEFTTLAEAATSPPLMALSVKTSRVPLPSSRT